MSRWGEFRMGWLFTMFDLPVDTKKARQEATRFRTKLLDEGFLMLQFSVYVRPCVTRENIDKYTNRVKKIAPKTGRVKLFFITDNQWGNAMTIECAGYRATDPIDMPNQMEFW